MAKHKILIMGAGKIGVTVASLLARTNDYESYLSDIKAPHKLPEITGNPIKFVPSDIRKTEEIKKFIKKYKTTFYMGIATLISF